MIKRQMLTDEVKQKLIKVRKMVMVYKVQLKSDKNMDKKPLKQLKIIIRMINSGVLEVDEKIAKMSALIFKQQGEQDGESGEGKED